MCAPRFGKSTRGTHFSARPFLDIFTNRIGKSRWIEPDCRSRGLSFFRAPDNARQPDSWSLSSASDHAELKNRKGAIPQCFEESPRVLGIIKGFEERLFAQYHDLLFRASGRFEFRAGSIYGFFRNVNGRIHNSCGWNDGVPLALVQPSPF